MSATRYSEGDRIYDREDGQLGRIVRVLSGAAVDYCTPIYEIVWAHAPGEQALGSRCYADQIGPVSVGAKIIPERHFSNADGQRFIAGRAYRIVQDLGAQLIVDIGEGVAEIPANAPIAVAV